MNDHASPLLHPVIMTIIGVVMAQLAMSLGWTWLGYVLDIYQTTQEAPTSTLKLLAKTIVNPEVNHGS